MGKKQLKGFEEHLETHYVDEVTVVMGLFSRKQKLEPRTGMWNQEVPSKAILLPALS